MFEFVGLCIIAVAGWFFWRKKSSQRGRGGQYAASRQEPVIADEIDGPIIKRTAPDQVELNLDPLEMPSDAKMFDFEPEIAEPQINMPEVVEKVDIESELDAALDELVTEEAEPEPELYKEMSTLEEVVEPEPIENVDLLSEPEPEPEPTLDVEEPLDLELEPEQPAQEAMKNDESKVVAFAVMAQVGKTFSGEEILNQFSNLELTFVEAAGFYVKTESSDAENPLFTIANMVSPGTFEPTHFVSQATPGILLFTRLTSGPGSWFQFSAIAETAESLAERLDGVLCDEQHKAISDSRMVEIQQEVEAFVANNG